MTDMNNQPSHRERCGYAIIAGLNMLAFTVIGSGAPTDAWRGVCALGCVLFLMTAMTFPAEAMDAHGPEQEPGDEEEDKNK
jgi:hypothetical protein